MHPDSNSTGMKKPSKDQIINIYECITGPGLKEAHTKHAQELKAQGVKPFGHGGDGNVHHRTRPRVGSSEVHARVEGTMSQGVRPWRRRQYASNGGTVPT